jgi:hypothetical protein
MFVVAVLPVVMATLSKVKLIVSRVTGGLVTVIVGLLIVAMSVIRL